MICFICAGEVEDDAEFHLRCCSCDKVLHYRCGMGYDDPVKAFKVSLGKQQYKCPICIVGSTYDAIHLALKALEKLAKPAAPAEGGEVQFDGDAPANVEVQDGDAPANVEVQDVSGGNVSVESHATSISISLMSLLSLMSLQSLLTGQRFSQRSLRPDNSDTNIPASQPRPRTSTVGSGYSFRNIVSPSELRRIKRCKGMLYGLKNIANSVDSLAILDSNARGIKAEDIDGSGSKVCLRQIGGLCCNDSGPERVQTPIPQDKAHLFWSRHERPLTSYGTSW